MGRNHPKIHISNVFLLPKKNPNRQKVRQMLNWNLHFRTYIPLFDLLQTCLSKLTDKVCVYLLMLLSQFFLFLSESIAGVYIVISFYTSKDCPAYSKQENCDKRSTFNLQNVGPEKRKEKNHVL